MDYVIDIKLPFWTSGITVYGDGEVDIVAQSGDDDITVSIELEDLREILNQAEAHKAAYDAFKANNYE